MGRIALNCTCGWNFFISEFIPGHETPCPSCGLSVRIPGRTPGMDIPLTAGAIAARIQRRHRTIRLVVTVAAAVVACTIYLATRRASPAPETAAIQDPGAGLPGRARKTEAMPQPPRAPDRPYNSLQILELRRRVLENVWLVNMATILSECLRYRNLTEEWTRLQAAIARAETTIRSSLGELARSGETVALDPYLAKDDRIVAFNQKDLTRLKPSEAGDVLHAWMNNWRAGPALAQAQVVRDDQKLTIYMEFPEDTRELLLLLRDPGLQLAAVPDRAAPDASPAESDTIDPVWRAVVEAAIDVTSQTEVFSDIVIEMRRRTESLKTAKAPVVPGKSVKAVAWIGNPLTFQPRELTAEKALEIGDWWGALSAEDRFHFAKYFGLWCANTRAGSVKK